MSGKSAGKIPTKSAKHTSKNIFHITFRPQEMEDEECYIGTLDEQGQFTPITSESNLELVHLGYLAYDSESSEVFIPNTEIRGEFRNAVRISSKEVFE